ncbi:hypothetical protein Acsp04_52100 [Actinomadura sp. NBRC 104425]|nr:hypothetical protein Acsp04_52100 [Actinomadura sp. NBRC 104425]
MHAKRETYPEATRQAREHESGETLPQAEDLRGTTDRTDQQTARGAAGSARESHADRSRHARTASDRGSRIREAVRRQGT